MQRLRRSLLTALALAAPLGRASAATAAPARGMDLGLLLEQASADGGTVHLPAGQFHASGLRIARPVSIEGVAGQTRIESPDGAPVFTVHGTAGVSIRGITFGGGSTPSPDEFALISAEGADLTLADCRFESSPGSALRLEGCAGRVCGNSFAAIGKSAIFARDSLGLEISGNSISDIGNNAIQVWSTTPREDGTLVSGNRITRVGAGDGGSGQNGNGIVVFRAGNVIVAGNRISDCAFSAVRNNSGRGCQIVNNAITRMGEVAIYCEFAFAGAVVSGNIIEDTGAGISITNLDHGGRLASIANNVVRRCRGPGSLSTTSGTGIHAEGHATLTGNVVEEARDSGISLGWGPYSRMLVATGNIVHQTRRGIAFSMSPEAGPVIITSNRIGGASEAAIIGHDHGKAVTGDLALAGAAVPEGSIIRDNLAT